MSKAFGMESTPTFFCSKLDMAGTPLTETSYAPGGRFSLYLPSRAVTAVTISPVCELRARTVAPPTAWPSVSVTDPPRDELLWPNMGIARKQAQTINRMAQYTRNPERI